MWKEKIAMLSRNRAFLVGLSASFGALGGALAAATVAAKRAEKVFREIADEEIAAAKDYYAKLYKGEGFSTPQEAFETLHGLEITGQEVDELDDVPPEVLQRAVDSMMKYTTGEVTDRVAALLAQSVDHEGALLDAGLTPTVQDGEVVEGMRQVGSNIFTDAQLGVEDFDPATADRDPNRPYIITFEEFQEGRAGFTQEQLTYYEGDDVLAKEDDEAVEDSDGLVGNLNLTKFGLGSQDADVVLVRNEKWACDIEITRHRGSFAQIVAGVIAHSDSYKTRKFRGDDE